MFAKWDRFSRNLMEGMQVLSEIKSLGIVPHCLETNVDDSVPENLLIQTILLTIPEIENARRSQNTIAGIRQALKEGRWPRKPPMGYLNDRDEYNNKTISIDPPVALIVRKAFQEAAKGKRTLQDIRLELNKEGLKCNKSSFSKLLRNQFYIGKVFVPAYKDEPEQIVMGVHDPIIDE
ncbi:MAG: recombinase family protein, partial [Bacteroidetes bacterium]